jgi:ubiquinone/menaquinone biosynthesis C-methylase UbiE
MNGANVGSGQRKFYSNQDWVWLNVDANPKWQPEYVAYGENMPEIQDGRMDVVVLHHVIEHAGCGESADMIRECHRILKPGGSLIVCVPDMYELVQMWLSGKLTDQLFFTNVYGAFMDSEADRHRWGFTGKTLAAALRDAAKWNIIKPFDWREIPGASIARDTWILSIECQK